MPFRRCVSGLMMLALVPLRAATAADEAPPRLPIPDRAAQQKSRQIVHELFKDDYAKRPAQDHAALARKLLDQARKSPDDPAAQYVLLVEAMDAAAAAADVKDLGDAADQISRRFIVNALDLRLGALGVARKAAHTSAAAGDVAAAFIALSDDAAAREEFAIARRAASEAQAAANASHFAPLMARADAAARKVHQAEFEQQAEQDARDKLRTDPQNPELNLHVGRYLCFHQGRWEDGLPLLAKAKDPAVRAVVAKEQAGPRSADEMTTLADAWWQLPEKSGITRSQSQHRAAYWYRRALPDLSGLHKALAEKRIANADPAQSKEPKSVDLLALLDPDRDLSGHAGRWKLDKGVLLSAPDSTDVLNLPYQPPREYDLRLDFARLQGADSIIVLLVRGDTSFSYVMDAFGKHLYALELCGGKQAYASPAARTFAALAGGRRHSALIQIRDVSVKTFLDNELVLDWKTDYQDLAPNIQRDDQSLLALRTWKTSTAFYKIEVAEITGPGKKSR